MANLLNKFGIVEQSPSKLVIENNPGILAKLFIIIWALGFGGIPSGLIVLMASQYGVTTLSCKRVESQQVDCLYSQSHYLGFRTKVQNQPIRQVTDAKFELAEWSNGKGGGTAKAWVSLINKSGKTRLFEIQYAIESGFKPHFQPDAAQQLKTFIQSQAPTFKIEEDKRWSSGFWIGVVFFSLFPLIAALAVYVAVRSQRITLDKTNNLYTRQVDTLLGTHIRIEPLDEIKSVEVIEYRHPRYRWRFAYQLVIVLWSGKQYKLPSNMNPYLVYEVESQIKSFLRLL